MVFLEGLTFLKLNEHVKKCKEGKWICLFFFFVVKSIEIEVEGHWSPNLSNDSITREDLSNLELQTEGGLLHSYRLVVAQVCMT